MKIDQSVFSKTNFFGSLFVILMSDSSEVAGAAMQILKWHILIQSDLQCKTVCYTMNEQVIIQST